MIFPAPLRHCSCRRGCCRSLLLLLPPHPPLAERRAFRAYHRRLGRTFHPPPSPHPHPHLHLSPLTSLSTSTTIPPDAIVKPRGLLVSGFPPGGAAGVPNHLTLIHDSYHRLTCPIVHRWSWTPGGDVDRRAAQPPHLPQPLHPAALTPQTPSTHSRFLVPPAEET